MLGPVSLFLLTGLRESAFLPPRGSYCATSARGNYWCAPAKTKAFCSIFPNPHTIAPSRSSGRGAPLPPAAQSDRQSSGPGERGEGVRPPPSPWGAPESALPTQPCVPGALSAPAQRAAGWHERQRRAAALLPEHAAAKVVAMVPPRTGEVQGATRGVAVHAG